MNIRHSILRLLCMTRFEQKTNERVMHRMR